MTESKMNITVDEIIEYLEQQIQSDSATEAEEVLYIEYQNHGAKVMKWEEHRLTLNRIIRRIKKEYGLI